MMTSRERLLKTLNREKTDCLPVTTHHVMPYFLHKYMHGITYEQFFDYFKMDPIRWVVPVKPDAKKGEYFNPDQKEVGFLQVQQIFSDQWRIEKVPIQHPEFKTERHTIYTPSGNLSCVIQGNYYTDWVAEPLIKEKKDIEIIQKHCTTPLCDAEAVNNEAAAFGDKGIVRVCILPFDIYGQPGCWQDACCLRGAQEMIMDTFDDPEWVHIFLQTLLERKLPYVNSMKGSHYDLMELGGGDASTTVISPSIFEDFVAPYDKEIITAAHHAGVKISYHTCGGMMPILESIAAMEPDAMETFTPPEMGADVDLKEAKRRIGDKVCMIGGFNQVHNLKDCSETQTRQAVRTCFEEAGAEGGYILAPSDHFFDADINLLEAFVDEARKCTYS